MYNIYIYMHIKFTTLFMHPWYLQHKCCPPLKCHTNVRPGLASIVHLG